jgi:hypothetical protein
MLQRGHFFSSTIGVSGLPQLEHTQPNPALSYKSSGKSSSSVSVSDPSLSYKASRKSASSVSTSMNAPARSTQLVYVFGRQPAISCRLLTASVGSWRFWSSLALILVLQGYKTSGSDTVVRVGVSSSEILPEVIIPPAMYIGPSFKNEPDTPCRALEHLVVLSSTSQDKVSLEASNAGNDTLIPNV